MRLKQWTKNLFVFAPILFKGTLFHIDKLIATSLMFASFCFASSAVYFFNDIFDIDKDRLSLKKCHRPIASGKIPLPLAYFLYFLFIAISVFISYKLSLLSLFIVASYIITNVFYTIYFKKKVIIDVMIVAFGFVLRAVSGVFVADTGMTQWFILCVMFLALFLGFGKRRSELIANQTQAQGQEANTREVLKFYSLDFLNHLMTIVTTAIIICYTLFATDTTTPNHRKMLFTVPLVVYGLFYYMYFVQIKKGGDEPDVALFKEKPILACVIAYILAIIIIRNI